MLCLFIQFAYSQMDLKSFLVEKKFSISSIIKVVKLK
jgi:hypothetical protein